jgi:hypothetical protein
VLVPRVSRYVIELAGEERAELERRAREVTAPWREVQRARMILYADEGLADTEIAARLDCHPEIVGRWRRRFCEQRIYGLQTSRGLVACVVFPPEQVAEVKALACELPATRAAARALLAH